MENILYADAYAKVKKVHVKPPLGVTACQLIIEFEKETEAAKDAA